VTRHNANGSHDEMSFLLAGWHAHDRRAANGRTDRGALRSPAMREHTPWLSAGGRDYLTADSAGPRDEP
jgi:hypothetical protein